MFSPSQLIQSMTQRANVAAPKPIELTPGQVFKGTVIKHYPNQMALVQIGPIQVQAKLEANLEPGQKAWLQVQPSSDIVTLKVLDTPAEGKDKGGATLEGLMRSLGLPETKESRAIVQALMNGNLPVTKETVQAFSGVALKLGLDNATIQAFMTAMKRNLPLTPDTVAGLKAFFSERPMSTVMQNFLQQAALFLDSGEKQSSVVAGQAGSNAGQGQVQPVQSQPKAEQTTVGDLRQLVTQLKEKIASLPVQILESGKAAQQAGPSQSSGNHGNAVNQPQQLGNQQPAIVPETVIKATAQQAGALQTLNSVPTLQQPPVQSMGSQPIVAGSHSNPLQNQSQTGQIPVQPVRTPASSAGSLSALAEESKATFTQGQQTTRPALGSVVNSTPQSATDNGNRPVETNIQTAQVAGRSNPIQQLFQQLGVAHERELMGQVLGGSISWDAGVQKQMESVKVMLLQLTQSNSNIPVALREAADQLLQQVTGQQLMLTQPANQSLSQIVMQIPLRTEQGDETAYVQIESKKKGSGQLDADNCRLFFHLTLQALGTTMIDVNLVKRIVNLQIFNDTPGIEALAHAIKGGFTDQLQEIGYSLSSMRVQPIPEQQGKSNTASAANAPLMNDYKGVDLRI